MSKVESGEENARAVVGIEARVRKAIALIKTEIDTSYDPTTGFYLYPAGKGRISTAEVLRRAGKVDKNTLLQEHHLQLRDDVVKFVGAQQRRLLAHNRSDARTEAARALTNAKLVDSYAQQFKAAEHRADAAERKYELKEAECEVLRNESDSLSRELSAAHDEIAKLREEVSRGRVVRMRPTRTEQDET